VSTTYKTSNKFADVRPPPLSGFNTLNFFSEDTNWESIYSELEKINWQDNFKDLSPHNILNMIHAKCFKISSQHVPPKKQTAISNYSRAYRYRRSLTNRRKKITRRLIKVTSPSLKQKLNKELLQIEKDLQKSHQNSASFIEGKAVDAIRTNSKYFYSYAKKKSKTK